ncbi:glycosyltransferase [Microbacterium profundi]|uniref:Glycosyltransferase n=1 Tax=Microbacterium profundi TaxID=450380 RepID=A0ABV3LMS5_9MICO
MGLRNLLTAVARNEFDLIEIPEPMAVRNWPQLLALTTLVKFQRLTRTRSAELVTYCIENYPVDHKLSEFTKLPPPLAKLVSRSVVGYILGSLSKVAYGTGGALDNYRDIARPRAFSRPESKLIEAIPSARPDAETERSGVVFLGTFERRKGFDIVCDAWPEAATERPDDSLLILGKGDLLDDAVEASNNASVEVIVDPPRQMIWSRLASAKVLILPSQPARGFREQVGLPIVEALSLGCEIVTSDETGIADWLTRHGHRVLPHDAKQLEWSRAIADALSAPPRVSEILKSLPKHDGRLAADEFLMSTGVIAPETRSRGHG